MVDDGFDASGKQKKGRRPFQPSDELRLDVRRMVGEGLGVDAIASAIGISEPTLRKHFAAELSDKLAASDNLFNASEVAAPAATVPPRTDGRGKGGGRPPYIKPFGSDDRVMQMVAVGMSEDVIALALGCSVPVYRRAYRAQIATGRQVKQAEVVDHLFRASKKGSVPAQKRLLDMMDRARLAEMDKQITGQPGADTSNDKPARARSVRVETSTLGKKLQAERDAQDELLTGDWGEVLGPGAEGLPH